MLFGLPFAAVGVGMAVWIGHGAFRATAARDWVETPARIVAVELKEHRGDDSSSWSVEAAYEYEYLGQRRRGTRVSFDAGADNIGDFQQRTYRRLAGCRERGEPVPCYVNPAAPNDAVLIRGLRSEMILFKAMFMLVFGGVGIGLMVAGAMNIRGGRRLLRRRLEEPERPWLWRDDWAAGEVRAGSRKEMALALAVALFWNAISLPLVILMMSDVSTRRNPVAWIFLLFPAVGAGLAAWAVRATLRALRFGKTVFEMAEIPGVLGGRLAGVIRVPVHLQAADGFRLRLVCTRTVTTGSGKHRHTSERELWGAEQRLARELLAHDPAHSALPVLFAVPFDQPPSSPPGTAGEHVRWKLRAEARVPGIDFAVEFEVPVFKTADSRPDFRLDDRALAAYRKPASTVNREP